MIKPTKGKLYCKVLSGITKTDSGIFLARTLKETPHFAKVLKVGKPAIRNCNNCDMTSCNSRTSQKRWKWYKHKKYCSKRGKLMYPCAKEGEIVHFKKTYRNIMREEEGTFVFLENKDIVGVE